MRATTLIFAAAVMQLLGPRPAFVRTAYAEPAATPITEIVTHSIDGDTNEPLQYTFEPDTVTVIGVVQGPVVMTKLTDPYGRLVADPCD